ncbi:hypothetical protein DFJ73DRAFT_514069 [Zopfochytrium polystomum]|nr:hypothetical protein DFJ73DRAFT_514069 [Zopfochytrium polystomum]
MRSSLHSGRTVDRPPSSLREVVTNGATSSDTDGLASPTRIESDESVPEGIPIGVENTGQESTPMVNPPAVESKALADVLPKKHSLGHAFSSIGAGSNSPTSTRSSSPTMSERRRQGVSTRQGSTVRFSVFDETFQINDLSPPSDDVPVAVIPGAAVTGEEHISKKYRAEASGEFTRVKRLSEDDQSSDDDKPLGLTSGKLPADTENGADAVKPDEEEAVGRPRMIRTPSRQSTSSNSSTKVLSDRIPVAGAASRRHSYLPSTSTTPPPIRTDPRTYRNSMYGEGSPTASLSLERSRSHSSMIGGRGSKDSLGGRSLSSTGTGRAPTAGETAVNSLPRRSRSAGPREESRSNTDTVRVRAHARHQTRSKASC